VLKNVISPDQPIIERDKVVYRDIDYLVVVLVAERFLSAIDFIVKLFAFEIKGLVLLVEILLKELFGKIRREAEG